MSDMVDAIIGVQILAIVFGLVGLFAAPWFIAPHAPPVGGEYWPYIHAGVILVLALLGMKLGAVVGYVLGLLVVFIAEVVG